MLGGRSASSYAPCVGRYAARVALLHSSDHEALSKFGLSDRNGAGVEDGFNALRSGLSTARPGGGWRLPPLHADIAKPRGSTRQMVERVMQVILRLGTPRFNGNGHSEAKVFVRHSGCRWR